MSGGFIQFGLLDKKMSFDDPVTAAFDLLRHVPPKDVEDRMYDIFAINEELTDDLISSVDVPFKLEKDTTAHQEFIKCDYNRDGDSYRSPYTNKYYPSLPDGQLPPPHLRKLEELANNGFQVYLQQYFREGVLSVYAFEISDDAFGVGVFVRKDVKDTTREEQRKIGGSMNCSDVFTITSLGDGKYDYQMVSSVLINIELEVPGADPICLSGGCADTQNKTLSASGDKEHLKNIGAMMESYAGRAYEMINQIYVGKSSEILSYTKKDSIAGGKDPQAMLAEALKMAAKK